MTAFSLKIVTPDGVRYDGPAEKLIVRTSEGDVAILAGHTDYVAALGMGEAMVESEGKRCYGACIGGMVSVISGGVMLVPTAFEWAQDIDALRAEKAEQEAQQILDDHNVSDQEKKMAAARCKRAQVRKAVASRK